MGRQLKVGLIFLKVDACDNDRAVGASVRHVACEYYSYILLLLLPTARVGCTSGWLNYRSCLNENPGRQFRQQTVIDNLMF